jgi:hypothetical protein
MRKIEDKIMKFPIKIEFGGQKNRPQMQEVVE